MFLSADYAVYAALLAIYFVLFYFFIKETKGLTIEESSLLYDDPSKRHAVEASAEQDSSSVNDKAAEVLDQTPQMKF